MAASQRLRFAVEQRCQERWPGEDPGFILEVLQDLATEDSVLEELELTSLDGLIKAGEKASQLEDKVSALEDEIIDLKNNRFKLESQLARVKGLVEGVLDVL